jgi:hypothetical protein
VGGGERKSNNHTGPQDLQGDAHRFSVGERCNNMAIVIVEVLVQNH